MTTGPLASSDRHHDRRADTAFACGLVFILFVGFWNGLGLWFTPLDWNMLIPKSWTASSQGNWLFIPSFFYRVTIELFGVATTGPIRLVGLFWFGLVALLFHRWARTKIAAVPAAFGALVVAWSGVAANVVMEPALMIVTIPLAMMFATWLAIDASQRWATHKATAYLLIGVLTSTLGVIVVLIIAAEFAVRKVPLRRWLIVAPATLVWVIWFLAFHEAPGQRSSIGTVLRWAGDVVVVLSRSLAGFAWPLIGVTLLGCAGWVVVSRRWTPRVTAMAIGAVAFVVVGASRSVPGGIFPAPGNATWLAWFMLVLIVSAMVEIAHEIRIRRWMLVLASVVVLAGFTSLLGSLIRFRSNAVAANASSYVWLGAVEAIGGHASGEALVPIGTTTTRVADLAPLFHAHPTLVSGAKLHNLGDDVTRQAADLWMLKQLQVTLEPGLVRGVSCVSMSNQLLAHGEVVLSGSRVEVAAIKMPANVFLRRFASQSPAVPFAQVPALQTMHFQLPKDNNSTPWVLQIDGSARVLACR